MNITKEKTYLHHQLAKVSADLGDNESALASYLSALQPMQKTVDEAIETGEMNWKDVNTNILDDYANYCKSTSQPTGLGTLHGKLTDYATGDDIEAAEAVKIGLLCLRLRDNDTPLDVISADFDKVVNTAKDGFGNLSQDVQDIYAEHAKFLHSRGDVKEMARLIRSRLSELRPSYKDELIGKATGEERSLIEKVKNRLVRDEATLQKLVSLHNEANAAYTNGDHERSFELHMEAAAEKYDPSEFSIGTFYQLGIGCELNMVEARKFYLRASEQGHAAAQHHYGALVQMGLGGSADVPEATKWYEQAASQGHSPAYLNLGALYCTDLLGATNYALAIEYFLISFELGNPNALDSVFTYFGFPPDMF